MRAIDLVSWWTDFCVCLYVETEVMLLEVFAVLEYSSELPSGEIVITPYLFNVLVSNMYGHPLESQVDSFGDGFPNSYGFFHFRILCCCGFVSNKNDLTIFVFSHICHSLPFAILCSTSFSGNENLPIVIRLP